MDNVTLIRVISGVLAGFRLPSALVCLTYDPGMEENAQDADPFAEPVTRMDCARLDRRLSMGAGGHAGQSGSTQRGGILFKLRTAHASPGSVLF